MCEYPSPSTAKSKLPGMIYTHLTRDERYQIAILAKAGHDQSEIADVMNRHRSTISRELRRNRGQRGGIGQNRRTSSHRPACGPVRTALVFLRHLGLGRRAAHARRPAPSPASGAQLETPQREIHSRQDITTTNSRSAPRPARPSQTGCCPPHSATPWSPLRGQQPHQQHFQKHPIRSGNAPAIQPLRGAK